MRIYLASPWFTPRENTIYEAVIKKIRSQGHELYVPRECQIENADELPNSVWGMKVFQKDVEEIDKADEVWVLNFGMYSDTGTAWECGYAYGKGKVIRQLLCGLDQTSNVYSLMMINGCDETDHIDNYLYNVNKTYKCEVK